MKKLFSILALVALTTSVMADYWFCDPQSTQTIGMADSWEVALAPSAMPKTLTGMESGDTLFIKGGTIAIKSLSTDLWKVPCGITIIGGMDPSLTGTNVPMPSYPSKTPTIFDGDKNGNGIGDAGDAEALIRVDLSGDTSQVCTLQGLILRNTYHYDPEQSTKDIDSYLNTESALRILCGTCFVKNCEFYNHYTLNRGSQAITVVGANVHLKDCDMHHCVSMSRGAFIRTRNYFVSGDETKKRGSDLVIERCCLRQGSAIGGERYNHTGVYGGAVHISQGNVFAINSTFVQDSTYSKGGAIRVAEGSHLTLISCTLGQNCGMRATDPEPESNKPFSYGSSIGMDTDAKIYLMNTIMLDDKDVSTKATAPLYTDDNTQVASTFFKSNGNNVIGTCFIVVNGNQIKYDTTEFKELWKITDKYQVNKNNRFTYYLGDVTKTLKDNGGCSKSIVPQFMINGASYDDLDDFAYENCPDWTSVDVSVDQRGYKRDKDETCVGAVAYEGEAPAALNELNANRNRLQSSKFNILGQPVDDNYKGIVLFKGQKYLLQ